MKRLNEDIKTGQFHKVYLLYGSERYLKQQYRKKLLAALVPSDDTMNFTRFEGKDTDQTQVISMAETLPFFADRRVILLENTGFFKNKAEDFADYLTKLPDYLVLVCAEEEADKRSRAYKAVQKNGCAVEFAEQKEETLIKWVLGQIGREGKNIRRTDMEYFLSVTGNDMANISMELEKLFSYTLGRDVITRGDIDAVCVPQITNRIFDMVRAVAAHEQKKALSYYYDLLAQKEPPMRILFLLAREFNILLQVKLYEQSGGDSREMASALSVPSFAVGKYRATAGKYTAAQLREIVTDIVQAEEDVKTGHLSDALSVELMIIKYAV